MVQRRGQVTPCPVEISAEPRQRIAGLKIVVLIKGLAKLLLERFVKLGALSRLGRRSPAWLPRQGGKRLKSAGGCCAGEIPTQPSM